MMNAPRWLVTPWAAAALLGVAALVPPAALRGQPPTYVGGTAPAAPTLTVLRTAPGDTAAPRAIVTVTFDRPVADALDGRAPAAGLLTIASAVAGRLRWRDRYDVSYVARATTSGSFVRPPARAEEMYDASLQGRSAGGRLIVTP